MKYKLLFAIALLLTIVSCEKSNIEEDLPTKTDKTDPKDDGAKTDVLILNTIIKSIDKAPEKFTKKFLIEDYTATWCYLCPKMTEAIEKAMKTYPDIAYNINIHSSNGGDPYGNAITKALQVKNDVTGFPRSYLDRKDRYGVNSRNYIEIDIKKELNKNYYLGLGIQTSLKEKTLKGYFEYAINKDITEELTYTIYITESGLEHQQEGSATGIASQDNLLRERLTNVHGDAIPTDKQAKNTVYKMAFEHVFESEIVLENSNIVVFISNKEGTVINIQQVKIGDNKAFD